MVEIDHPPPRASTVFAPTTSEFCSPPLPLTTGVSRESRSVKTPGMEQ